MSDFITDYGLSDLPGNQADAAEVEVCKTWLTAFVSKRKTINKGRTSYGLKHYVEHWAGVYVANGAFIQAAIDLGYDYKRIGPNAWFNMSFPRKGSEKFKLAFKGGW